MNPLIILHASQHNPQNPMGSIIMMLIILAIPLSWVIPIIVKANKNKKKCTQRYVANRIDQLSQLERLAKLKEQGVLTEEEFLEQKNKILNK
jgi:uncharacterized membrane protein